MARRERSRRRWRYGWRAWLGRRRRSGGRFRLVIMLLVGVASVLAAVGAWRTEAHASRGDELDRDGVAQQAAFEREQTTVRLRAVDLVGIYAEFEAARAQSAALARAAVGAAPAVAAPLRVEAGVEARHAGALRSALDPDAFVDGRVMAAGLEAKVRGDLSYLLTTEDLYGFDEFRESDRSLRRADADAGFTALAIAAAFLLTLAHLIRRRVSFLFLAAGSTALVAALVLIVLVEVLW